MRYFFLMEKVCVFFCTSESFCASWRHGCLSSPRKFIWNWGNHHVDVIGIWGGRGEEGGRRKKRKKRTRKRGEKRKKRKEVEIDKEEWWAWWWQIQIKQMNEENWVKEKRWKKKKLKNEKKDCRVWNTRERKRNKKKIKKIKNHSNQRKGGKRQGKLRKTSHW